MNRGWMVAGILALAAVPAVPAAAAGVAMVLERVDDPVGMLKWIRTGDVLRYEVRLNGMARDARLAVAATPVHSLTELSCARALPPRPADTPDPGGAEITARALAGRALAGVAVPGAQACKLGRVSAEKAVQVVLSVPPGAERVEVAAVARMREEGGGLTTITRTAATPVMAADVHTPPSPGASDTVSPGGDGETVRTDDRGHAAPEIDRRSRPDQGVHRGFGGRAERDTGDRERHGARVGEDPRDRDAGRASEREGAPERDGSQLHAGDREPRVGERGGGELRAGEREADSTIRREAGRVGRREPGEITRRELGRNADEGAVKPGEEGRGWRGVRGADDREAGRIGADDGLVRRAHPGEGRPVVPERANPGEGRPVVPERANPGEGRPVVPERADPGGGWPVIPERVHQGGEVELPVVAPPLPQEAPLPRAVDGRPEEALPRAVEGAPLPRVVDGAPVRVRAEEPSNPLAGPDGVPFVAGGIGVLLAGLWAVAHAQTRRKRRKVF